MLWGAPRIHGELLKLSFAVAQSTVAKYMAKMHGSRPVRAGVPSCAIGSCFQAAFRAFCAEDQAMVIFMSSRDTVYVGWLVRRHEDASKAQMLSDTEAIILASAILGVVWLALM